MAQKKPVTKLAEIFQKGYIVEKESYIELMFTKKENLPIIALFISIFVVIIMGFIMGALIENSVLKGINSNIEKILEQPSKISILNSTTASIYYAKLIATEPLIVGFNIIDLNNEIVYSDEPSLVGKTFSEKAKISKAVKNKNYYAVDRNLISQETILKEGYKSLLILFYYFEDAGITLQLMYDTSSKGKDTRQITSLLWFTILLSVGVLFIVLISISNMTRTSLEKAKKDLEIDVKKRTEDLQTLSADLDRQVKERTKDLEVVNKELIKKSINLTETTSQLEDKNYELESAIKNLNSQNKDLIRKTMALTELQGQLDDKNYELEKANNEIISLMESRIEFMNSAAHDLRTPITPILLLIPTIKNRIKDIGILYDIKVIEKNANYLKQIADKLISYLKSSTGQYKYIFKKTDIKDLIEDVLATYREAFNQNRIEVIKRIPKNLPLVEVDELKITEVLQNLVSNALKFMPRVGKLIIDVKKRDNFINVKFEDSGIGMSKKTLSKIFVEFYKADESRHIPGEGLGLSICKKIIEDHHGRIWAESKGIGKGSTILFDIPISQKVMLHEKEQ